MSLTDALVPLCAVLALLLRVFLIAGAGVSKP